MAGPMTHMMVAQTASDPGVVSTIDPTLQNFLIDQQRFLLLGAVAPDLPAILDALHSSHVSDRLHDGKLPTRVPTNTTVCELYARLKGKSANSAEFAFLLGYACHAATDSVVHPLVNAIVDGDSIQHRHCETCQDSLLFHDVMKQDITRNDYLSWLELCDRRPQQLSGVLETWQPIVNQYYGHHSCRAWFDSYRTAFSIARQMFYQEGWSYPRATQIAAADVKRFYSAVRLPVSGAIGHFRRDVFERAVRITAQLWQEVYRRFIDPAGHGIDDVVKDWDLNDGRNVTTGQTFDLWS